MATRTALPGYSAGVDLSEEWRREEQQPFVGWDFSHLAGRLLEEKPPWSYPTRAAELLVHCSSVLEMGSGGGERFGQLRKHWPSRVTVTEEYPPNVALVRQRFEPLGVRVAEVRLTDVDPLPFANAEFDLVLNRHSAFNSAEIGRVLAPSGTFFTQQVHGRNLEDLQTAFHATPQWPDSTPEKYVSLLGAAGLQIVDRQEWTGKVTFTDVGAIVYYLKAVPWMVTSFSVTTHASYLQRLQARVDAGEQLVFTTRTYLIEARR
jgi:SAM-dependent methyltransferase